MVKDTAKGASQRRRGLQTYCIRTARSGGDLNFAEHAHSTRAPTGAGAPFGLISDDVR